MSKSLIIFNSRCLGINENIFQIPDLRLSFINTHQISAARSERLETLRVGFGLNHAAHSGASSEYLCMG